jgi:hypothetical protein
MAKAERIEDAVDALLAAPAGARVADGQTAIESVLTEGYARALELEAERLRSADRSTVAALTERVRSLRRRLEAVRRRYGSPGSLRHDDLDRRARAGCRVDDELSA